MSQAEDQNDIYTCAMALLTSRLYFCLDTVPTRLRSGHFRCKGTVKCRLSGHQFAASLQKLHPHILSFAIESDMIALLNWNQDVCRLCHRFNKKVEFTVRDLGQKTAISIQDSDFVRNISAFPCSMKWFIVQQQLGASFGTRFHQEASHGPVCVCELSPLPLASLRGQRPAKRMKMMSACQQA